MVGSVCQHLLFKGAQTLIGYDIYYFLSHIISSLHKVLINAFGDEAFSPLRKAWNLNEYHGLGCSTTRENGTRRWESGPSKKSCLCDFSLFFFSLIFRTCHGRVVAIPGTQTAATPTTASQIPETSPVPWWSSGSKLETWVCFYHKDIAPLWTDLNCIERSWASLCIMKIRVGVWCYHLDLRIQLLNKSSNICPSPDTSRRGRNCEHTI